MSIALLSVQARVGLPVALLAVPVPSLVAILALTAAGTLQRSVGLTGAILTLVSVGYGIWLMSGPDVEWDLAWLVPATFGVSLVLLGPLVELRRGGSGSWVHRFVPLAAERHLAGREAERRRLAAVVHDEVLPQLGSSLREVGGQDPAAARGLQAAAASLRDLMNERQTVVLDAAGLVVALQNHITTLTRKGLDVSLTVHGAVHTRLPARVELELYRITQVALDNAVRHAAATTVEVIVSLTPSGADIAIVDDGRGMDENVARSVVLDGHLGLSEMNQRSASIQAHLTMTSSGAGTTVSVRWRRR